MKKMKSRMLVVFAAVACMAMTSCKQLYYQVYDVNSNSLKQEDNSLVYENDDLKVMYNLWGEDGAVGFIVQNKTDKDLFIDMNRTFIILNGEAKDYFMNREYTNTTISTTSTGYGLSQSYLSNIGYWPTRYYVPTTTSAITKFLKGNSSGITTKEKKIVCVLAGSYKVISEYKVSPQFVQTCESKKDFPSLTYQVATYSEGSSPVKFKNRIAYSFDSEVNNPSEVENDFYVSSVTNYSKKAAIEKKKETVGCNTYRKVKREYFKIGGPNKFYKIYVRQHGSSDMYE